MGASNPFSIGDEGHAWGIEGLTVVQDKIAELYANERQECQTTVNHCELKANQVGDVCHEHFEIWC